MLSRRDFLKFTTFVGASLFIPANLKLPGIRDPYAPPIDPDAISLPSLDPTTITKYVTDLVIPPAMPVDSVLTGRDGGPIDYYRIGMKQFSQQILPSAFNPTTVWSYYAIGHEMTTLNYPAFTIEAQYNRPVRVEWINQLMNNSGGFIPHIVPVDQTLHWANPPGPERDSRPQFLTTPGKYLGPVPIVTHLHGAHTHQESDGFAQAWYLPNANNIPLSHFKVGSYYDKFKQEFAERYGQVWEEGSAVFQYPNDQRACTLWYHDHALGMTRCNVYAGPAGFYIIRGGDGDLPAEELPAGNYEIVMAIQDRAFYSDGSLFYPDTREYFDGFAGPYVPYSDIAPIMNPEFFGNVMLVNGKTWPVLHVEPRRYRFRILNGCNSRTLILRIVSDDPDEDPINFPVTPATPAALPFWLIGTDGGFLPAPVELDTLLVGNAFRDDVIVDFSEVSTGTELWMVNFAPDFPYNGTPPTPGNEDGEPADPVTTGQVMKFIVDLPLDGEDESDDPAELILPAFEHLGDSERTRQVSLNELESEELDDVGPRIAQLGTVDLSGATPVGVPMMWDDPTTETPFIGETETWEIYNFTVDGHPIHLHQVMFEVINRQSIAGGPPRDPETWETGFKDTVIALPGDITRIKVHYDIGGQFVWHCHIVEHEDNEMMRPVQVLYRQFFPLVGKDA
jgi:spore coat protein A, manganese oxidase